MIAGQIKCFWFSMGSENMKIVVSFQPFKTVSNVPVYVQSAGCGRTGAICAIDYTWNLLKAGVRNLIRKNCGVPSFYNNNWLSFQMFWNCEVSLCSKILTTGWTFTFITFMVWTFLWHQIFIFWGKKKSIELYSSFGYVSVLSDFECCFQHLWFCSFWSLYI